MVWGFDGIKQKNNNHKTMIKHCKNHQMTTILPQDNYQSYF